MDTVVVLELLKVEAGVETTLIGAPWFVDEVLVVVVLVITTLLDGTDVMIGCVWMVWVETNGVVTEGM